MAHVLSEALKSRACTVRPATDTTSTYAGTQTVNTPRLEFGLHLRQCRVNPGSEAIRALKPHTTHARTGRNTFLLNGLYDLPWPRSQQISLRIADTEYPAVPC